MQTETINAGAAVEKKYEKVYGKPDLTSNFNG
jgi:hypothetical protein